MPFDLKFFAALALVPALVACGSPADESDEPLAQDQTAPSDEILTAEPADAEGRLASGEMETGEQAGGTRDSQLAEAALTSGPAPFGGASPRPGPSATIMAAGAAPPPIFAVCGACHGVEAGDHGIGPSLAGVFNSKAGGKAGYAYSDALKNSGLTWNQGTLDRYLENPRGVLPGTTMAYNGLKNAQQRQAVIAYLKEL